MLALEPPMKVCELMSVFSSTRGYDRIRIELRIMIKFGFRFWFLVSDIFSVLVLCHKPFEVYCLCHNFSSSVVFKPGSSGQSRMAPSPLLCLSLSWREPSGKSSSPRLSKKKKNWTEALFDRSALPFFCQHPLVLFQTTRTAATSCHTVSEFLLLLHSTHHHFPSFPPLVISLHGPLTVPPKLAVVLLSLFI